jgi:hypothetical protein
MSDRLFPDFADTLEWNLVARASYIAPNTPTPVLNRLPNRQFLIENSYVVMIGTRSDGARSYWQTGCWASQLLPFLPSSTSDYVAAVQSSKRWVRLRTLNLLIFPKLIDTWILDLAFPYWLPDVSIEVWRYDGRDIDQFQRFNELEAKLP